MIPKKLDVKIALMKLDFSSLTVLNVSIASFLILLILQSLLY